ncbi:BZ3500_MvSof-1268-A1-R1_Chr1-3g02449 [Microbotryum saponariae]|uniref:BZ3500_MvSof-1268-A1-R1_Chr1-3g02449 protein n=1 Tax=Microbotryum saponariae TaxID=289078 RepID=A0A2X0KJ29_9BASI|nr:BZ3500_MvSof-1268-A1-R1_Chr1-3g02449 [Microbotryum saponariae]SCZ96263.1 BZ3501_MvSof-1269-A2-R1_Chr1-3g02052 [Microbotryum saponariae]
MAPACKTCTKTSHATQQCPDRHASNSQGVPKSRASPAATPAAATGSKSVPAAHASDRRTKKRRVEQDLAVQPAPSSNNDARPELSFNFPPLISTQAAPHLPPNQGTDFSQVEKSSEPPSPTPPSSAPMPPPVTPKTIMTRSKSIASPAPTSALLAHADALSRAQNLDPKTPTPTTMPTKKPKTKEHLPRTRKTLWTKMMSATKIPNVSFVAANVQSINEDCKRASLFSNLRSHNAEVFLLSETGRPSPERVAQWTQECQDLKFSAVFTPFNNTAILWKSDSVVITIDPESPPNTLRTSFSFPDRVTDATFRAGDSKVRVVSIYAPSSDKPDKKRFLSHLSNALRHAVRDDPSGPPALLVGCD